MKEASALHKTSEKQKALKKKKVVGNQHQVNTGFTAEAVSDNIWKSTCSNLRDTQITEAMKKNRTDGSTPLALQWCHLLLCWPAAVAGFGLFERSFVVASVCVMVFD